MSALVPRVMQAVRWCVGLNALFGASLCWAAGPAGIKLDGTLGGAAAVLAGPTYNITQGLGKLSGNNLFYSFQYFNVATGERALFSTSTPGISNVISRVTGGFASSIDGTISLQAASGAPNFFFINPSGVTFSSNAVIDVPAAFYVSTANYLKFPDGNFYADPSQHSTLSAAAPEAFGFLGSTRAPVEVLGATLLGGNLGTAELQVTAGDVTIDGGGQATGLINTSGEIRVTAVGNAVTEVPLSGPYAATDGTVTIRDAGLIAVDASAGAGIEVNAGNLLIDGQGLSTGIASLPGSTGTAGLINVEIGNDVTIADGGGIFTTTNLAGNAGEIFLSARSLEIGNLPGVQTKSGIFSDALGNTSGDAGPIDLQLGSLTMDGGGAGQAVISSETTTGALGAGGNILITVSGAASIVNGAIVTSATSGAGKAGDILLNAHDTLIQGQTNPAVIESDSTSSQSGPAGNVAVEGGSLTIDGGGLLPFVGISSSTASDVAGGTGGSVGVVVSGPVAIYNGGGISASTSSMQPGGAVLLSAGSLLIEGDGFTEPGTTGNPAVSRGTGVFSVSSGAGAAAGVIVNVGALGIAEGNGTAFAGISADAFGSGSGGTIGTFVTGEADIVDGGEIRASARPNSQGSSGQILVQVGSLKLDGAGNSPVATEITASTNSAKDAGDVAVIVAGDALIENGAGIASASLADGNAGKVGLQATNGNVEILNGGFISSISNGGAGNAGDVAVAANGLLIQGQGAAEPTEITSSAFSSSSGHAGAVDVSVGVLEIDGSNSLKAQVGISSDTNSTVAETLRGNVVVTVSGDAQILNGGAITTDTSASQTGGDITFSAGSLEIVGMGYASNRNATGTGIISNTAGAGTAGNVTINAGSLLVAEGAGNGFAGIQTLTTGPGTGGEINITVVGQTQVLDAGEIRADATSGSQGKAGSIQMKTGSLKLDSLGNASGTIISADTGGSNDAGSVQITTGSLSMNGHGAEITTDALNGSLGSAGDVTVTVSGDTTIENLAGITSAALGAGNAGQVSLQGKGNVDLLNGGFISSISNGGSGNAGNVSIGANQLVIQNQGATTATEITSTAFTASSGSAGTITVKAASLLIDGSGSHAAQVGINSDTNSTVAGTSRGNITVDVSGSAAIVNGGTITTDTSTQQTGGDIMLSAANLTISGQGYAPGGNGRGTGIISNTTGSGNAGSITINAGALSVAEGDSNGFAGIQAQTSGAGAGGKIGITVSGAASIVDAGEIRANSNSNAQGDAGSIDISAGSLLLDSAGNNNGATEIAATTAGSGAAGTIKITTGELQVLSFGLISIANSSTAANANTSALSQIMIDAQQIFMDAGFITASSAGNVPAAGIDIHYNSLLRMDPSEISTTAVNGNGGPITISGRGPLILDRSAIETSVTGTTNGNGGAITINVPLVVLNTGAIQANTNAPLASGGTVVLNAQALIPSFESFRRGGDELLFDPTIEGLNVVQAAAPDGVSGTLNVTPPQLDLGNSLLALTGRPAPPTALGRSLCGFTRGSSLAVAGRGGAPVSAYDPLWIDPSDVTGAAQGVAENSAGGDGRIERVALLGSIACR